MGKSDYFFKIFSFSKKMNELKHPPRGGVRRRELPNDEGHLSEQLIAYKRKNSGYVSKLKMAINKMK